jgi:hypothetical protein
MDYVTRQFINLAKKLRDDLRQTLQKHTDAINQSTKAARDNKQNQLPIPLPVIAELKIPEADKGERRVQYDKSHSLQIWLTVGTWLAFLAAAIYAGIAANQFKVMRGQLREIIRQYPELQKSAQAAHDTAEVNKEALYSVQRAFLIFPADPEVTLLNFPSDSFFELEIPIENVGATQAHRVKDRVSCVTSMGPLSSGYSFPDIKGKWCGTPWAATGASVIPAKSKLLSQQVFVEGKIVQEFMQQNTGPWAGRMGLPSHPTRTIVFYGWVTYRDIFKDSPERLSEFCRTLATMVIQPQRAQSAWGYCPTHNCTDEDCPDYKERIKEADASPTCCPSTWFKKND